MMASPYRAVCHFDDAAPQMLCTPQMQLTNPTQSQQHAGQLESFYIRHSIAYLLYLSTTLPIMAFATALIISTCLTSTQAVATINEQYNLRPFHINLTERVPRMLHSIRETRLPERPEYPSLDDTAGINLDVLKSLRQQWLDGFDWNKEQASMNRYGGKLVQHSTLTWIVSIIFLSISRVFRSISSIKLPRNPTLFR